MYTDQAHRAQIIYCGMPAKCIDVIIRCYYRAVNVQGNSAYHPAMMTKILLYVYSVGIPSSWKIAKVFVDDLEFRWLAAGNFSDFRTIAKFRRRRLEDLLYLFSQILLLYREAGLVKAE